MAWDSRPATAGRARCAPYLEGELALLSPVRVLVAFDRVGFDAYLRARAARGEPLPRPRPAFTHGAEITLAQA